MPEDDDSVGRLRLAVTRLARLLRQQDAAGLTPTLLATLATIAREGQLTLGDLAAHEQVAPPTVTKIVTKLESAGLVERRADADDGRVRTVHITAEGKRQLDAIRRRRSAWLEARVDDLEPEAQKKIDDAVEVLEALIEVSR